METNEEYKKWWLDAKEIINNLIEEAEEKAVENHKKITSIQDIRKNVANKLAMNKRIESETKSKDKGEVNVVFKTSETKADGYRMNSISVEGLIAEVPNNPYDKDVAHMFIKNEDKTKFYGLIQQVHNNGYSAGFAEGTKAGFDIGWEDLKNTIDNMTK